MKITCETCQKAKIKYTFTQRKPATITAAYHRPFVDEDGKEHHHSGNTVQYYYQCSNGHTWEEKKVSSCWCGWSSDQDISY